jgi:hypothetical protein
MRSQDTGTDDAVTAASYKDIGTGTDGASPRA